LVIDDPVSSLDSSILFVVSTLIREVFTTIHEEETNIKQVILLTHNVYFHKEVAFLDRSCKWRDDVYFWILRKNDNVSMIQPFM
jgi:wobble nucleotide-excising tRNase